MIKPLQRTGDDGFTLPELLIVVVVMSFIVPAMVAILFLTFNNATDTSSRLRDSSSAQAAAAYFASDVQSADTIATSGSTCVPAGHTAIVRFEWQDPTDTATLTTRDTAYFVDQRTTADGTTVRELHRTLCQGAAHIQQSDLVLISSLDASDPSVTCNPGCSSLPATVTLAAVTQSGFAFKLSGTTRSTG